MVLTVSLSSGTRAPEAAKRWKRRMNRRADGSSAGFGAQAGRVRLKSAVSGMPNSKRTRPMQKRGVLWAQNAAPTAKMTRPSQMLVLLKQSLRLRSVSV